MTTATKKRLTTVAALINIAVAASADCGTTDYGGNSGRLYDMVKYITAMCTYTVQLMYAIAAIMSIYSATSIYIKLQSGEEGFTKSIIILVGSCLFMIGATIVLPAFFGFNYGT